MGIFSGSPPTFSLGEKTGVAAKLNTLRDFARAFTDPFSAWTPTLTQSATVTATATCGHIRAGKLVVAYYHGAVTGAGTAGNAVELALPVTAAGANRGGGAWWHLDSGVAHYTGYAAVHSASVARFYRSGDTVAHGITLGTLSSGDTFSCVLIYEAA